MALELGVVGLMNVQFAVQNETVFIIEVNPRASRTVPFVSKAMGQSWAKVAARVMAGKSLDDMGIVDEIVPQHVSVKESVFPFAKFPGVDTLLGPEMKSTGEVMGIGDSFGAAFAKAQIAAGTILPTSGKAFLSVRDEDKAGAVDIARRLTEAGMTIVATSGTARILREHGLDTQEIFKVGEGSPNVVDAIQEGEIALVINTPQGYETYLDSFSIRRRALECRVPYFTTIAGAVAAAEGIVLLRDESLGVCPLQEHHGLA